LRNVKVFKKEPKVKEGRKDGLIISSRLTVDDTGHIKEEWKGEKKSISNLLLQRYLYDELKLKRQTKDGHTTSDEVAIRNLMLYVKEGQAVKWKGDIEKTTAFLQSVLDFRDVEKTIQFLSSGAVDSDGRIRAAYGLNVQTGRLRSAGNPAGTGYNLQNVQRNIRHFFIPDRGSELGCPNEEVFFIEIDLKQAEDLVVKTLSYTVTSDARPLHLVQAVASGTEDIHKRLASDVFGVPPTMVTYEQRYVTKRCRHGINNGMGYKRMQQTLLKDGFIYTINEVKRIFDVINAAEPWVEDFHRACRRAVMRRSGVATSWGWQLRLDHRFERLSEPRTFNRAYTFIEQSEVGVLLKQEGLLTYWNRIRPKYRARLNMLVHDNLVLSVPRSELYDVISILYRALTAPRRYGIYHPYNCSCGECGSVPTYALAIPAEIKISRTLSCSCEACKQGGRAFQIDSLPLKEEFEERFEQWKP
jgi:DNA polymerase I-like protein with 3'-5' exonuclease and polymerase domains